jgi:colanic acid/amylovoran biosynthesis glycosyltransferase
MQPAERNSPRVGYVLKRYPRFSETFVVNEVLAHEAAGWQIDLFALGPSDDTHFQDIISRVRAPLTYLRADGLRAADFWDGLSEAAARVPGLMASLTHAGGQPARDVYQAAVLAKAVVAKKIDLLHAHFASSAANIARLAARFAGVPFTFTAHAKDIFHREVDGADLRTKLREAAAAVTVSEFNLNHLRREFGADAARVHRVYNGIDLARFPFSGGERARRVIAVGRLVEKKGFDDLVRAAAELKRCRVEFSCLIVGHGEMEQSLKSLIAELRVGDRVELCGPRPQHEVIDLLRTSAVLAAPCVVGSDGNRDGLPTVLLEAMALGTPCVSTDVTGIPEVIREGETGLAVPQRDPVALAGAIQRLLRDGELGRRVATAGRRLIESEFDQSRTSGQLRRIFAEAVRGPEAPPSPEVPDARDDIALADPMEAL